MGTTCDSSSSVPHVRRRLLSSPVHNFSLDRDTTETAIYSGFRASSSTNVSQVRQYSRSSFSSEGSMIASLLSVSSPQVGQVASPLITQSDRMILRFVPEVLLVGVGVILLGVVFQFVERVERRAAVTRVDIAVVVVMVVV